MLRSDSSPSNSPRSGATAARFPTIALVGNPNTGKTSLFNALTGFRRHTANYPGVTVEVARGRVRGALQRMELIDLPGTYSLAAQAPDEMIVTRALCGRLAGLPRPDAILAIVDAANPVRNFYLVSQLLEMGLPVVVALNMMDVARARGIEVDVQRLEARLGLPVIPVTATQEATVKPLVAALEAALTADPPAPSLELPRVLADETERLRVRSRHRRVRRRPCGPCWTSTAAPRGCIVNEAAMSTRSSPPVRGCATTASTPCGRKSRPATRGSTRYWPGPSRGARRMAQPGPIVWIGF